MSAFPLHLTSAEGGALRVFTMEARRVTIQSEFVSGVLSTSNLDIGGAVKVRDALDAWIKAQAS